MTVANKHNADERMKYINAFFLIRYIYKGKSKEKWNYVNGFLFRGIIKTKIGIRYCSRISNFADVMHRLVQRGPNHELIPAETAVLHHKERATSRDNNLSFERTKK